MKRKNLDLTEDCIKEIAKEAIDKGTDFKNLAQDINGIINKPCCNLYSAMYV